MSNNKKKINLKTVGVGLLLQFLLAVFIIKTPIGAKLFGFLAEIINKILQASISGSNFVFGWLTNSPEKITELFPGHDFIFALIMMSTMILILVMVNILYYYGIMQRIILFLGKIMNKILGVSGAEALSNCASPFVGNVAAQSMIKHYLPNLTRSELLASMTGSTACISASCLAMYTGFGINTEYLLAASVMAIPGSFVVSKIVYPETMEPQTKNEFKISKRRTDVNILAAISKGASEGMRVSINVIAGLLALVALITFCNEIIGHIGLFLYNTCHINLSCIGIDMQNLSIEMIVGKLFASFAALMGTTFGNIEIVGRLIGEKLILNEAIAYIDLANYLNANALSEKSIAIATFACCGFANFSTVAIQISGIGELAPSQRKNLARLGVKALICGTLVSYISAAMAGILL
ncbi:NupC/NupG family nucleoside CNT transporter [bacterium]|nr:NupC/NupG family nucleoside CNT transporter [bacterium]